MEKEITNDTLKDAPYEMSDSAIVGYMSMYGEVVSNSIRHGRVVYKGKSFDNGTTYLQIINCSPTLPNVTQFGKYPVRIFADNGRTACSYCGLSDHPSYRCGNKDTARKTCFYCKCEGHVKKDCPELQKKKEKRCYQCNETGHLRRNCPNLDDEEEDERYSYDPSHEPEQSESAYMNDTIDDFGDNYRPTGSKPTRVVLGASNCKRCELDDENVYNASISGMTLVNIANVIDTVGPQVDEVEKVVVCLGTNDISRNKTNPDRVNVCVTKAVELVTNAFEYAEVGICTVIPRKGSSVNTNELNAATNAVNDFIRTMCEVDEKLALIDVHAMFVKEGVIDTALYDQYDPSGIHVNAKGAKTLADEFQRFFTKQGRNLKKRDRPISASSSNPSPISRTEKKSKW